MGRKKFAKAKDRVRYSREVSYGPVVVRPYVFIEVAFVDGDTGNKLVGRGFAKCLPTDEWDEVHGINIAQGRAEVDIARQLCAK